MEMFRGEHPWKLLLLRVQQIDYITTDVDQLYRTARHLVGNYCLFHGKHSRQHAQVITDGRGLAVSDEATAKSTLRFVGSPFFQAAIFSLVPRKGAKRGENDHFWAGPTFIFFGRLSMPMQDNAPRFSSNASLLQYIIKSRACVNIAHLICTRAKGLPNSIKSHRSFSSSGTQHRFLTPGDKGPRSERMADASWYTGQATGV